MNKNNKKKSLIKKTNRAKARIVESEFSTSRILVSGSNIPKRIIDPKVRKVQRLYFDLSDTTPSVTVTGGDIGTGDANDYAVSGVAYRYNKLRVDWVKVWLDQGVASNPSVGLSVTDLSSGITFTDYPAIANTLAAIGMQFGMYTRSTMLIISSTTTLITIVVLDPPTGFKGIAVVDFGVEFQ